jgi:6-phosphogluconate dehydrogenase
MPADIGLIGLAVMGQNLVRNMDRNGFRVAVYNRTAAKTQEFLAGPAAGAQVAAAFSLEELVGALARPRKIMLMVQAGKPVDAVIAQLAPLLEPGDLLIDGGNSFFPDTERRSSELAARGLRYLGVGVSGGEEGALWGPSLMPGGQPEAYELVQPIYEAIAARAYDEPCVTYIGPRGAGHYVKMVHNGIEYGDMQLIAEAYDLLHRGAGLSNQALHEVFDGWNRGPLQSFLIEITAAIFAKSDDKTGGAVVDVILDRAGQKGTGKWTSQNALDLGVPATAITEAVFARALSAAKDERLAASGQLSGPDPQAIANKADFIQAVGDALYASKVVSYAQGFALFREASQEYGYGLDYGEIARIWRGGCIIRAAFLNDITAAYRSQPDLPNLLVAPFFRQEIEARQANWRRVVMAAVQMGIPAPAMSAALAYFDGYRSARLPANLIQAQRDYFGAHTYERIDEPRGQVFHTNWSGHGGDVTAGTYNA